MTVKVKRADEVLDYVFEFGTFSLDAGETITGYSVTTKPGLTKDFDAAINSARDIQASFSGGIAGAAYWCRCTVTTSAGRTYADVLDLEVIA